MFGRSPTKPLQYVGAAVALVALVGTVMFGWEFGTGGPVPLILGIVAAALAVGWELYRRLGTP